MRRLSRLVRRSPAHVGARALTALGAAALVLLLALSDVTAPVDDALFDLVAGGSRAGNPQVVVVTIDPESIAQHGPWPWPRRDLATLVDRLSAAGTRAVGLQLLLAQNSLYDPQGDALLAQAMARNGAVVLPVVADLADRGRPATAILPAPVLAAAAAALGHTEAIVDDAGIARRIALHAGLGTPKWPAFALALRDLAASTATRETLRASHAETSPTAAEATSPADDWVRSDTVLVAPTARGPGIDHVTAAGVLSGQVNAQALAGRIVLVGRTDLPLDQRLSLPGAPNSLPRVDFQANALARLLEGRAIWPMPVGPQILLSIILVTLPLLLLGLPGLRRLWAPMGVAMALVLVVSWALLLAAAWFPPMPALLVLAIGLAIGTLRAWRRLRQRSFTDPATGVANRQCFDQRLEGDTRRARRDGSTLSLLLIEARGTSSQAPGGSAALAAAMAAGLRLRAQGSGDLVARLDAGRFAALLPGTAPHVASALATALMVDLEGRPGHASPATAGQALRMGLASLQPEDLRGADLLLRATRDLVTVRDPTAR
ncbi:sensor domain CHASE2-containing protein [Pseudoxanthomonas sp. GM95]|uniref:CHASE2 domain-containing protein n=1 Tax=Pseudoxanthomonas sp. GM95 TaxID=1881043 RepID=UPI0008C01DDC|nr:CHASE2 domain-containing protein [Pseudoxanthomonas sp. GM95]SEL78554.1 sensor domain CHASE2-containing protein [Pseudoxanthomonas sp. GM95]